MSKTFGFLILIETTIAILQYLTGHVYFDRPLGTIGESNAVFGFLAMGTYFVLNSFSKFYLIPLYIVILVSGSRSALLSLIAFSGIFFKKFVGISFLVIIFGAILYVSSAKTMSSIEDRATLWKIAVTEISKKPILGYGAEAGEFVFRHSNVVGSCGASNLFGMAIF